MPRAIDILMEEHRLIERVLDALEACVHQMDQGKQIERQHLLDFADFFANYADKRHHAKEEDRLFVKMVEFGFPREEGPLGVMLMEHTQGRQHVGALRRAGEGKGPLGEEECRQVRAHALAYVPLLREHIAKEDHCLYPMAVQALPPQEMERLASDFQEHEAATVAAGDSERYQRLASTLLAAFPPKP